MLKLAVTGYMIVQHKLYQLKQIGTHPISKLSTINSHCIVYIEMPRRYFRVLGKPWQFDLGVRPNDVNYTSDTLKGQVWLSKLTFVLGSDSLHTKHQVPLSGISPSLLSLI